MLAYAYWVDTPTRLRARTSEPAGTSNTLLQLLDSHDLWGVYLRLTPSSAIQLIPPHQNAYPFQNQLGHSVSFLHYSPVSTFRPLDPSGLKIRLSTVRTLEVDIRVIEQQHPHRPSVIGIDHAGAGVDEMLAGQTGARRDPTVYPPCTDVIRDPSSGNTGIID